MVGLTVILSFEISVDKPTSANYSPNTLYFSISKLVKRLKGSVSVTYPFKKLKHFVDPPHLNFLPVYLR